MKNRTTLLGYTMFILLSLMLGLYMAGFGCGEKKDTDAKDDAKVEAKADAKDKGKLKRPLKPLQLKEERYNVPVDERSPMKGEKNAMITIMEFSEFQCPFCNKVNPTIAKIMEEYKGKVRVFWRHNPLPFHKDAELASIAGMAAHQQGKFWEMHDKMFENQRQLKRENLEKFAVELGLDMDKFKKYLDDPNSKKLIESDKAAAKNFAARGTPHFFVNGIRLRGAQPYDKFKTLIDKELVKAQMIKDNGVEDIYAMIVKNGMKKAKAPEKKKREEDKNTYKVALGQNSPLKGAKDGVITIMEFSEFQCPFCNRVNPSLKKVMEEYKGKVRIYFRHLPLPFHKNAIPAASAAIYANEHGKFWEMHDKLFENSKNLTMDTLVKIAKELGLNADEMKKAIETEKYKGIIESDKKEGNKFGARGTPSFFINGRKLVGAQPFANFKKLIDELLPIAEKKAKETGKKGDALYLELTKDGKDKAEAPKRAQKNNKPKEDPNKVYDVPAGNSYFKGAKNAPVTIIEISEFQCPFCSRVNPTIDKILKEYKGKVKVVFKHNPLPFHKDAQGASEAALAAGEQGKFWEMHDKMFANQRNVKRPDLEKYAQEIGLDMDKFKKSLDSGVHKAAIDADKKLAAKVGARGTPTLFVNGRKIVGAQPFENFKKLIDEELAKKK